TGRVRLTAPFPVTGGEVRVAFSAGDRRVVLVSAEGTLAFCELQNRPGRHGQGRQLKITAGPKRCVALSPDGTLAVVVPEPAGRGAPSAQVWSLTESRLLRDLEYHSRGTLTALTFTPNGLLLSGGTDGAVCAWDIVTGRQLSHSPGHAGPVRSLAVASDGRQALSAGDDASVRLWDLTLLPPRDPGRV